MGRETSCFASIQAGQKGGHRCASFKDQKDILSSIASITDSRHTSEYTHLYAGMEIPERRIQEGHVERRVSARRRGGSAEGSFLQPSAELFRIVQTHVESHECL